jgi:outer membrane lipoprotein-sorting protein
MSEVAVSKTLRCVTALLVALAASPSAPDAAAEDSADEVLSSWLARQAEIQSWTADVVQTRRLESLVRPLTANGRVWFRQPNRFRWQLGDPPKTIAVRTEDALVILYPRLQQAERYALGAELDPAWQQALALLEVGFPQDPELFRAAYGLMAGERIESGWRLELQPADADARRLLERIRLELSADDLTLLATELVFPDGSTMRNDFSEHRLDVELEDALFEAEIGDDYTVVNPLDRGN